MATSELIEDRRGFYIRYAGWVTMMLVFIAFLLGRGMGIEVAEDRAVISILLMGASVMIFLETAFTKEMEWIESTSINFLVGVPGSVIAFLLAIGYYTQVDAVVSLFESFEGGIYLSAVIILLYQGVTALMEFDPTLDDFRKN